MNKRLLLIPLIALALSSCSLPSLGQRNTPTAVPTAVVAAATTEATQALPATAQPTEAPTTEVAASETTVPAPTQAPTVAATATPVTEPLDNPERIAAVPLLENDEVELFKAFKNLGDVPTVARTTPLDVQVGDVESFAVSDLTANTNYSVTARLRYAGPIALMYVDTRGDASVSQADIEQSAREFEQTIYPRDRALFGQEASPGIDGDPRLTLLFTPLRGAGGYFSNKDTVVKQINRFSNERDMFVVHLSETQDGDLSWGGSYGSTLAHEFQHMIEWNEIRDTATWFNEGMSTLAEDLNGYVSQGLPLNYLDDPDLKLTDWATSGPEQRAHYGMAQLFLRYFHEQYTGDQGLAELIKSDAGNHPEVFASIAARKRPEIKDFTDLFADWAVANAINDPQVDGGRYAYSLLPEVVRPTEIEPGSNDTQVHQLGADYLSFSGPGTLTFDGADTVTLTGTRPSEGNEMWWSKRGDDSYSTLTREFDLTGVNKATLQFATWYEIELNWDYAYVTVSTDGGAHWTTLQASTSTADDPQGANLGNGITGISGSPGEETDKGTVGQWIEESVDLTPYAGKKLLVRFWMVQDTAYNAKGLLIDNIRIPELNYQDGAESDSDWQAQGFVRTTGELAQRWTLRLIEDKNGTHTVTPVPLDDQGRATITVGEGSNAIVMISASTPLSSELANYRYELK